MKPHKITFFVIIFLILGLSVWCKSVLKARGNERLLKDIEVFISTSFYNKPELKLLLFPTNRIVFVKDKTISFFGEKYNIVEELLKEKILLENNLKVINGFRTIVDTWGNPIIFINNNFYDGKTHENEPQRETDPNNTRMGLIMYYREIVFENGFLEFGEDEFDHIVDITIENSRVIPWSAGVQCISAGEDGKITNLIAFDYCTDKWDDNFELIPDGRFVDCDNDNVYSSLSSGYINKKYNFMSVFYKMYYVELSFALVGLLAILITFLFFRKKRIC